MKTYGDYEIELLSKYTNKVRREVLKIGMEAQDGDKKELIDSVYRLVSVFIVGMSKQGQQISQDQYNEVLDNMGVSESEPLFEDIIKIVEEDDVASTFIRGILLPDSKKKEESSPEVMNLNSLSEVI